jgi:hypothetical protein
LVSMHSGRDHPAIEAEALFDKSCEQAAVVQPRIRDKARLRRSFFPNTSGERQVQVAPFVCIVRKPARTRSNAFLVAK